MIEDVFSPPYPDAAATADGLFNSLRALRQWVEACRDDLNALTQDKPIALLIPLPNKQAWLSQPVAQQYGALMYLQKLRESFDAVVRNHEDAWDSRLCALSRIMLAASAARFFNDAFTPQERREAEREKHQQQLESLLGQLGLFPASALEGFRGQEKPREEG